MTSPDLSEGVIGGGPRATLARGGCWQRPGIVALRSPLAEEPSLVSTCLSHGNPWLFCVNAFQARIAMAQVAWSMQPLRNWPPHWEPVGLSHAAAYMLAEDLPCTQYLARFTDEQRRLAELMPGWADTEGYGQAADAEGHRRTVATTWEISIKAADTPKRTSRAGSARRASCRST